MDQRARPVTHRHAIRLRVAPARRTRRRRRSRATTHGPASFLEDAEFGNGTSTTPAGGGLGSGETRNVSASANGLRRLDEAAIAWTELAPSKGRAVRRHVSLALLAAAPILAWDLGVGAPGDAWNVAVGLLFLAPVLG